MDKLLKSMNNMKNFKKSLYFFTAMLLLILSCKDEEAEPIVTSDSALKGAFIRGVTIPNTIYINPDSVTAFTYTYEVEFVDPEDGEQVSQYVLDLEYRDREKRVGMEDTTISYSVSDFKVIESSAFKRNSDGFMGTSVTINAQADLVSAVAAGFPAGNVNHGDVVELSGKIVMKDGREFSSKNTSATVQGSAFVGHFDFDLLVRCPTVLETGDVIVVTDTITFRTCEVDTSKAGKDFAVSVRDTIKLSKLTSLSSGAAGYPYENIYTFDDWSFGTYPKCYLKGGAAKATGLSFREQCGKVEFIDLIDEFAYVWVINSTISGKDWTINWENSDGESGKTVVTFPKDIPFTLEE